MLHHAPYQQVRDLLLSGASCVGTQEVPLLDSAGRILAQQVYAKADVPPFDRSAYDGYTFRSGDTRSASKEYPVTLSILEEVPAGHLPTMPVVPGTATKILTGAPIPEGADAVIAYEKTTFDDTSVTIFQPAKSGANIVRRGEDILAGTLLADQGTLIDASLAGTLAGQGIHHPLVYRKPVIGLLSTGTELVDVDQPLPSGKIYNSNLYTLSAAIRNLDCEVRNLGIAGDTVEAIASLLETGIRTCDAVVCTGGVSVGDYDLTPAAMEAAGAELLAMGLEMKPGMACAFARKQDTLLFGLSGNPASSMTTFYTVVQPVLKKMAGRTACLPEEITVTLLDGFSKPSPQTRLLRGKLVLREGTVGMRLSQGQGNVVISSSIGNNVMAVIPGGSGPVPAGTALDAFLI